MKTVISFLAATTIFLLIVAFTAGMDWIGNRFPLVEKVFVLLVCGLGIVIISSGIRAYLSNN